MGHKPPDGHLDPEDYGGLPSPWEGEQDWPPALPELGMAGFGSPGVERGLVRVRRTPGRPEAPVKRLVAGASGIAILLILTAAATVIGVGLMYIANMAGT